MTSSTEFLTVSMPLRGKDTNTRPDADTATPTTCCSNSATICRSPTSRSTGRSEATGVTFSTLCLSCSPANAEASRETDNTASNTAHAFFVFFISLFIEPVNSGTLLVVTEVLGEFWRDLTCRTWPCDAQTERGEATGLGLAFMSPATQEQGSVTSVMVQHLPMINGCRQRNAPLP